MLDMEVGGRIRRVDARGSDVRLDGRRVHVDAVGLGRSSSLLIGPADIVAGAGRQGRSYEVSIVELAFSGNVLREFYRISLEDGRAVDVATGQVDTAFSGMPSCLSTDSSM